MGWAYPDGWKALRNPHLRMNLLHQLHTIAERKDGHADPALVKETVNLLFDQADFATEPGAEIGNALFDINEGRAVFRLAQAVLKATQGSLQHAVRPIDWAAVQTLSLSACALLVRKGVAHLAEDGALAEAPPYNER